MRDAKDAELYWRKAIESLAGADSEMDNGRYYNAVNRAYYAAFQAAIFALLLGGIRTRDERWAHAYVQSEFAGKLVNRRLVYSPNLRETLSLLLRLRRRANYRGTTIRQADTNRAIRLSREFVESVRVVRERS